MGPHQSVVLWAEADGWHFERRGTESGDIERGTLEGVPTGAVAAAKAALAERVGGVFVWEERRYADTVAHVGLPETLAPPADERDPHDATGAAPTPPDREPRGPVGWLRRRRNPAR